ILSIAFEFAEYSLQHQLANFAECWWDHWVLDVLICNWLGTYIGMKTCQYLEVKHFSWRDVRPFSFATSRKFSFRKRRNVSVDEPEGIEGHTRGASIDEINVPAKPATPKKTKRPGAIRRNTKRMLKQFSPHDFTAFEWGGTTSFTAYFTVVLLLSVFLAAELNPFYLKFLLWMEPSHPFVIARLVGVFLCGLPAVRELYQYMNDSRRAVRMGQHVWLLLATIITELLVIIKWSQGIFTEPMPGYIKVFLSTLAVLLIAYPAGKCRRQGDISCDTKEKVSRPNSPNSREKETSDDFSSCLNVTSNGSIRNALSNCFVIFYEHLTPPSLDPASTLNKPCDALSIGIGIEGLYQKQNVNDTLKLKPLFYHVWSAHTVITAQAAFGIDVVRRIESSFDPFIATPRKVVVGEIGMTTPINVQLVDGSDGSPMAEEPTPTQVQYNDTVTGSPFETTMTVTGSQTVTNVPRSSGPKLIVIMKSIYLFVCDIHILYLQQANCKDFETVTGRTASRASIQSYLNQCDIGAPSCTEMEVYVGIGSDERVLKTMMSLVEVIVSAGTVVKRAQSPLDPLLSMPSQASVGQPFEIQFHVPNNAFYEYKILVTPPNGPQSSNLKFSNFLLPEAPMERFCIPFSTVTSNSSGSATPDSSGIWQVAIEATIYYGKNGYEYQANNTSGEKSFTVPVQVQVVDSSTPLNPASTVVPDPTEVEFNATVTGTPFETTRTFDGSQTTTQLPPNSSSQSWGEVVIDRRWSLRITLGSLILSLIIRPSSDNFTPFEEARDMFGLYTLILGAIMARSVLGVALLKRAQSPLDPFLSGPSQALVGKRIPIRYIVPNLEVPTERVCITIRDSPVNTTTLPLLDQAGTWQVGLSAHYYYGSNVYEYETGDTSNGKACISPPYTNETATVIPITVQVMNISVDFTATQAPEPTRVEFNETITGTPFTIASTQTNASSTPSSGLSSSQGEAKLAINRNLTWGIVVTLVLLLVLS
ncbi:13723_t:CDS:10, partial [Acaulospora colombiana]